MSGSSGAEEVDLQGGSGSGWSCPPGAKGSEPTVEEWVTSATGGTVVMSAPVRAGMTTTRSAGTRPLGNQRRWPWNGAVPAHCQSVREPSAPRRARDGAEPRAESGAVCLLSPPHRSGPWGPDAGRATQRSRPMGPLRTPMGQLRFYRFDSATAAGAPPSVADPFRRGHRVGDALPGRLQLASRNAS